jgi:hypothetical protein
MSQILKPFASNYSIVGKDQFTEWGDGLLDLAKNQFDGMKIDHIHQKDYSIVLF